MPLYIISGLKFGLQAGKCLAIFTQIRPQIWHFYPVPLSAAVEKSKGSKVNLWE